MEAGGGRGGGGFCSLSRCGSLWRSPQCGPSLGSRRLPRRLGGRWVEGVSGKILDPQVARGKRFPDRHSCASGHFLEPRHGCGRNRKRCLPECRSGPKSPKDPGGESALTGFRRVQQHQRRSKGSDSRPRSSGPRDLVDDVTLPWSNYIVLRSGRKCLRAVGGRQAGAR
jgi:hypothetical protein